MSEFTPVTIKQLQETADGARTFMLSRTHTRSWLLLWSVHPEVERTDGVFSSLCALICPLAFTGSAGARGTARTPDR